MIQAGSIPNHERRTQIKDSIVVEHQYLEELPKALGTGHFCDRNGQMQILALFDSVRLCLGAFWCAIISEHKMQNALFPMELPK